MRRIIHEIKCNKSNVQNIRHKRSNPKFKYTLQVNAALWSETDMKGTNILHDQPTPTAIKSAPLNGN